MLTHHALGTGDRWRILRHAADAGRAAARSGAHTQAATFFRLALDSGAPLTPAAEAELLERLAQECYLIDRLDDAIAASAGRCTLRGRGRRQRRASAPTTTRSPCTTGTTRTAARPTSTPAGPSRSSRPTASRRPTQLGPLGHALAMQAYLALHDSDLAAAQALLGQSRRPRRRRRRPDAVRSAPG